MTNIKQEILAAVETYRRETGPGSLAALAKRARVSEGALRDMVSHEKVPFATWRAVGKALNVGAAEKEEAVE